MNFGQWVLVGLGGLFFLYVVARLVSAAYFKSKQDHENMRKVTR